MDRTLLLCKSEVVFLQSQVEEKERTIRTLQAIQPPEPRGQVETCNAATQTERVRPLSTGPILSTQPDASGGSFVSIGPCKEICRVFFSFLLGKRVETSPRLLCCFQSSGGEGELETSPVEQQTEVCIIEQIQITLCTILGSGWLLDTHCIVQMLVTQQYHDGTTLTHSSVSLPQCEPRNGRGRCAAYNV
ncbi:hypothetical protein J6590_065496 [Homalodisca vitripennis]|nr:hypothetical protein J6590_065496 [Homalodisca vitripennis]